MREEAIPSFSPIAEQTPKACISRNSRTCFIIINIAVGLGGCVNVYSMQNTKKTKHIFPGFCFVVISPRF